MPYERLFFLHEDFTRTSDKSKQARHKRRYLSKLSWKCIDILILIDPSTTVARSDGYLNSPARLAETTFIALVWSKWKAANSMLKKSPTSRLNPQFHGTWPWELFECAHDIPMRSMQYCSGVLRCHLQSTRRQKRSASFDAHDSVSNMSQGEYLSRNWSHVLSSLLSNSTGIKKFAVSSFLHGSLQTLFRAQTVELLSLALRLLQAEPCNRLCCRNSNCSSSSAWFDRLTLPFIECVGIKEIFRRSKRRPIHCCNHVAQHSL